MVSGRSPWDVKEADCPAPTDMAERLRFLVRYAILAPSSHNTQPWLFRVSSNRIDLLADRTRALPVVDPHDRALTISCGAALGILRLALSHFGHASAITLLPDPNDPDRLAQIKVEGEVPGSPKYDRLFHAITQRRTTRRPFEGGPLPPELTEALMRAAKAEHTELRLIAQEAARARIAELVAEGDKAQFADPHFRRELAAWIHSRRAASRDGMSGAEFGMPDLLSGVGALVVRTFDMGNDIAAKDRDIAAGAPALAVLATDADAVHDWLAAGQALIHVLLSAAAAGATAAYLNQPVEVAHLRPRLREAAGVRGVPQILLRVGYGPAISPSARRPIEDVLIGGE